ncbi:cation:dicarboxylate symporter family transporter [Burkholderia plantarii]|uniref:cation:dicarboxylate symporter family transporter n=1 Tax=Burkholderia plantarii TaxID=41899 RepID=UPI001F5BA9A6|nr:cation:dicarboxylase symporter family transporter [Burkholderia plantarii]
MATRTTSVPLWRHLYLQVLVAIALGVALGHFAPNAAVALKPLGDLFVRLIRMVIAPVVFCAVVAGIASMRDMKAVGRAGGKALLHFELISSVALGFGLLMGHLLHPGAGFNVSVASLDASAVSGYVSRTAHGEGVAGFLMHAIPETFVGAFTHDEILPVLLIAMLCGSALSVLGERVRPVVEVVEGVAAIMFRIVGFITRVAPLGAFDAIAFNVGRFGVGSLLPMFKLVPCFYPSAALFVFVVLGVVARLACPLGRSARQVSGWLAPMSAAWSPAPPPAASLEIVAETRCSTSVPEQRGLRLFSTWWKSRICWRHARNGKRCRLHGSGRRKPRWEPASGNWARAALRWRLPNVRRSGRSWPCTTGNYSVSRAIDIRTRRSA